MQFTWSITHVGKVETIGEKSIPKQTIVLEEVTDREYKGSIAVDFRGDKTSLLEWFNVWDEVTVYLNSRAREYNNRRYNGISCRRIDGGSWSSQQTSTSDNVDDDLPF